MYVIFFFRFYDYIQFISTCIESYMGHKKIYGAQAIFAFCATFCYFVTIKTFPLSLFIGPLRDTTLLCALNRLYDGQTQTMSAHVSNLRVTYLVQYIDFLVLNIYLYLLKQYQIFLGYEIIIFI